MADAAILHGAARFLQWRVGSAAGDLRRHDRGDGGLRGIAALGMKSLGGSGELVKHGAVTPEQGLRYAMSLPVATTISGVDTMQVLNQNLKVAVNFQPLASAEMQALRDQCRFLASDGRLELFKMTTKYDGKIGREQHHFPTTQELPI